ATRRKHDGWVTARGKPSTSLVPSCRAIRREHDGWDTARFPKPGQEKL
ncbi:hypothetical protein T265_04357, partial [Opisthorchis viverrini]